MGLFDIFRKNEQPDSNNGTGPSAGQEEGAAAKNAAGEGYPGDLEKTERLAALITVPREERDENWVHRFLTDLPAASFRCGNPQVIAGPDGFPYFQLFLPEPGLEFQSFVIERMKDDFLIERGYGVVINPGAGQPEWVLSYGDILNLHLNDSFLVTESEFSTDKKDERIEEQEEVMVGQPSVYILPAETRKLLKDFFELNGISDPKVLLMMRKQGEKTTQDLAFNITPALFESAVHYKNMMQTVTWYLPRYYSIIGLDEQVMENGFMPL
jgi:hypothetical protein